MADIHTKINIRSTGIKWQKYTVKSWQDKFIKLRIGQKDSKRVDTRLISDNQGIVQRFLFMFAYYLRFVDWGVGRGVSIGDVGLLSKARRLEGKQSGNRRRPKRWYYKPFAYNLHRLAEIMAEKYAEHATGTIKTILEAK